MAVMVYNDHLRNLLTNVKCVLAFDRAADFLGLSNGGYRSVAQMLRKIVRSPQNENRRLKELLDKADIAYESENVFEEKFLERQKRKKVRKKSKTHKMPEPLIYKEFWH